MPAPKNPGPSPPTLVQQPSLAGRGYSDSDIAETLSISRAKGKTVTTAHLVEEVTRIVECSRREAAPIVETVFESVAKALREGRRVEIRRFGSFATRRRRGRIARNPKSGQPVQGPPKKIPFFKPSQELREIIQDKRIRD